MRRMFLVASISLLMSTSAFAETFGVAMPEGPAMPVVDVLTQADAHTGHAMKFSGRITQVCQKKGCWVMLEANGQALRVKTQHAFFVPKNATGTATVFGELKTVELSEEQATHFAKEDGGVAKPGREWQIIATSIDIQP